MKACTAQGCNRGIEVSTDNKVVPDTLFILKLAGVIGLRLKAQRR